MLLAIKLSGKVLEDQEPRRRLCLQLSDLVQSGHKLLVVHGGGKQLSDFSHRLGIIAVQYQGRRVTDEPTLKLAKMVFSAINRDLVAGLMATGTPAIGMSSFDAGIVYCRRRPPIPIQTLDPANQKETHLIDFGLVGEVEGINIEPLEAFWEFGLTPVMNCLGADREGQIFNVNADTLAAELAVALKADRLIGVSDVDGVYLTPRDPSTRIAQMTSAEAYRYVQEGRFYGGMVPKIESALDVLRRGVASVQIVSGIREGALLEGVKGQAGTSIVQDRPTKKKRR
ncbi:MAG: acetylglutamate kinase [Acidobacteriota bacterium]